MKTLHVDLGERSYPIFIGANLLEQPDCLQPYIKGRQVLIVTNETIAPLYLDKVERLISRGQTDCEQACCDQVDAVILPDGEAHKNLDTLNQIYDALLSNNHNRTTTLIALGGGVIGDMCGYAAASYQRGVNFIQIPTTLLAQVDSSVGGKTGVNHPLGKNMIGAFHQPQCVVIDLETLSTLPDAELSAGLAEVIKYGLICDRDFYQWLQDNVSSIMAKDTAALAEAILRSCDNKARVVAKDEYESGIRAILNLGHTFGHAIEAHQGYGNWLHGEAVAAGMVMAADLSARMGLITPADVEQLQALLVKANLPIEGPANMSDEDYLSRMKVDKKVLDGRLRLVLLKAIGEAWVTSDVHTGDVTRTLAAVRAPS